MLTEITIAPQSAGKTSASNPSPVQIIAAAVTAFDPEGRVDLGFIAPMAAFLERRGMGGVFINGTTGEAPSLSIKERMQQAESWRSVLPKAMRLFVHAGACSGAEGRMLASHAEEIGANAIAAMAPAFFRPGTVQDLVDWCAEIAEAAPSIPFYYYHIPSMNGTSFRVLDILEAAKDRIPNLAGVKYTFETLDDFLLCHQFASGQFDILWGRDEMLLGGLATGARGAVGSTYNIAAPLYKNLVAAFEEGDLPKARSLQAQACRLIDTMVRTGNFLAALKYLLSRQGIPITSRVRPPLAQTAFLITRELEGITEAFGNQNP